MAMACPKCREKKTNVRETRNTKRTRLCPACGETFITQEVFEQDLERLKLWHEKYIQLVGAIEILMTATSSGTPPY